MESSARSNFADSPVTKLSPEVKAKILARAAKARGDFSLFIALVWKFTPMKHQKAWIKELKKVVSGETQELLLVAPRGAGKSALVAVLFLAWMIGNNPTKHYGLISYTDKIAYRRSRALRNVIEFDPVYRLIFPDVKPDFSNWSRESFNVKRPDTTDLHPTCIFAGSTSAIVSSRLDGLVYDDPHDEKNSKTAPKRRAVVETYDGTIYLCLQGEHWVVCICTRYADDDLPGRFIERGFTYLRQRAITRSYVKGTARMSQERSYAPKLKSLASLRKERERNPAVFELQMQGNTKSTGGTAIKRLVTYQENELPELQLLLIQAGTDTNYKDAEVNDYCVIFVGGLDKKGNVWMLDRRKGRWDVDELADLIIELHTMWHFKNNWVEDSSKGTPAVTLVRKKTPRVPCELQLPSSGGKRPRASSIAPYLNSGQVKWPAKAKWLQDAEYYLTHFPNVDHDDDLDALFMLLNNLFQAIHWSNYGAGRPKHRVTIGKGRGRGRRTR